MTGTPGTGKSSLAEELRTLGYDVRTVEEIAEEAGCIVGYDEAAGSKVIDTRTLSEHVESLKKDGNLVIEGHLSHKLPVDIAVVLRCSPSVLEERLAPRGYAPQKLRENLEAEGVDVILTEAVELIGRDNVYEVDTTSLGMEELLSAVLDIVSGKGERYRPGSVDWSKEVMSWY